MSKKDHQKISVGLLIAMLVILVAISCMALTAISVISEDEQELIKRTSDCQSLATKLDGAGYEIWRPHPDLDVMCHIVFRDGSVTNYTWSDVAALLQHK